jgi:hypothetical protein
MTTGSRVRLLGWAATAVVVALAAGCGGGSSSSTSAVQARPSSVTPTPTAATSVAPPPVPASKLALTVADLPSGWAVYVVPSTNSRNCAHDPLQKVPTTSYTRIHLLYGGSSPGLAEAVGTYASSEQAFQAITESLSTCTSFTGAVTYQGQSVQVTGRLGAMFSFPTYGSESAAYSASATGGGTTVVENLVIARQGNALVDVGLTDIGSVDKGQLQNLVARAMTKARIEQAKR